MTTVMRGIYLLANDTVADHAIALVNSIRARDASTPIELIPYDDRCERVAGALGSHFGIGTFEDLDLLARIDGAIRRTFGAEFFWRPNMFRKHAVWFGPFDEFLYLDADILVFERVIDNLDHLTECDFLCCDDQHLHEGGLRYIFTSEVLVNGIFSRETLRDVFNGGWWASRKGMLTEDELWGDFEECAGHLEYFDFATGVCDQPVLNYIVLKRFARRRNLFRFEARAPRMWAGTRGFRRRGDRLFDPVAGRALRYLHWAGTAHGPGRPYWRIWKHYRLLRPEVPQEISLPSKAVKSTPGEILILRYLVKWGQLSVAGALEPWLERRAPRVRELAEWYFLTARIRERACNLWPEAVRRYDEALRMGFHEFPVRLHRGSLYARLADVERARADLLRATLLRPDHREAKRLLNEQPA